MKKLEGTWNPMVTYVVKCQIKELKLNFPLNRVLLSLSEGINLCIL